MSLIFRDPGVSVAVVVDATDKDLSDATRVSDEIWEFDRFRERGIDEEIVRETGDGDCDNAEDEVDDIDADSMTGICLALRLWRVVGRCEAGGLSEVEAGKVLVEWVAAV